MDHNTQGYDLSRTNLSQRSINAIVWNSDGVGCKEFFNIFKEFNSMCKPSILALLGIHISKGVDEVCNRKIGFKGLHGVEA